MSTPAIADLSYLEKSLTSSRIDETGTFTYIGMCAPEDYDNISLPVWQIKRFDTTNGEGMQYADNSREANKVWNDRSSYF
jgi:hypothetical protein